MKICRYILSSILFLLAILSMSYPMEVSALELQGEIAGSYQGTINSKVIGAKAISGSVEGGWTASVFSDGSFTAKASGTMGGESFSGSWQSELQQVGNGYALVGTWSLPGSGTQSANKFQWNLDTSSNAFVGKVQGVIPDASGGGTVDITIKANFPQFPQKLASYKGNLGGSWTATVSGSISGTANAMGQSFDLGSTPFSFSMDGSWSGIWAVKDSIWTGSASGGFEGAKTIDFTVAGVTQSVPVNVKGEWLCAFNINPETGQLSFTGSWVEFGHAGAGIAGATFGGSIELNISAAPSFPLPVSGSAGGGGNLSISQSGTVSGFPYTANVVVSYGVTVTYNGSVSLTQ